ncbi:MAG: DNA sulfur modification protein DndD [Lewinellaceae bacterium]|nr:DNA sulfur modification protein DndD [Lewinellaceae bacterium]
MIIKEIVFENFKPYCGKVNLNLETTPEKNVVLIGGRNGQGKTSFLVGVVWCLYGKNMASVDEIFSKEVKNNYTQWLQKALNWQAKNDGNQKFSVSVILKDVELSEGLSPENKFHNVITLKRSIDFNSDTPETFKILIDDQEMGLISDETEQINFINDFIIPIDIAKFVFFDAEKIAEIASLDSKDRAMLMDKSFGQILGLNTYAELIQDLKAYEQSLKRQNVENNIEIQVSSYENEIRIEELNTINAGKELDNLDERIESLKAEQTNVTNQLIRRGDSNLSVNLDQIRKKEEEFNEKLSEVSFKFNELSDLIPFAIIGYKLEEVHEHLTQEEEIKKKKIANEGLVEKTKELADKLFNKPNYPANDISMEQKIFYYEKAKSLLSDLYLREQDSIEIDFEHGLNKSDVDHLGNVLDLLNKQSKDTFESLFNDYLRVQNDILDIQKQIRMAEAVNQDEFIQDLQDRKKEIEKEIEESIRKTGQLIEQNQISENKINSAKVNIERLLSKVTISKKIEQQINLTRKYIKALETFITDQKNKKVKELEVSLLREINQILNKHELVTSVEMELIPIKDNFGLDVRLFNNLNQETNPNSDMSKGEQQLYISALLKAVLAESIHSLPILIDTPLGRIDQEHRDNILQKYYPFLSDQVIIFSTNTEIRTSDVPKIEKHIAKKYKLEYIANKTIVHAEYF